MKLDWLTKHRIAQKCSHTSAPFSITMCCHLPCIYPCYIQLREGILVQFLLFTSRVTYDHLLPLHKRQCLVTIIFTNLPSLHPFAFHEMVFILVFIINSIYFISLAAGLMPFSPSTKSTAFCKFCCHLRFKAIIIIIIIRDGPCISVLQVALF